MANTFEPRVVPSDVIAKWPGMAWALWRRSIKHQAIVLLLAAFVIKAIPDWKATVAFILAPPLFWVCFAFARAADEQATISWMSTLEAVFPGVLRLVKLALKFAGCIALGIALAVLAADMFPQPVPSPERQAALESLNRATSSIPREPENIVLQFFYFCATWMGSAITIASFGMFVVVLYQAVFGTILHAQEGMGLWAARIYAWRAWSCNAPSIERAVKDAPRRFWRYVAIVVLGLVISAQSMYLSFLDLALITYIPCFSYVAYRSIFYGKNENVPAASRSSVTSSSATLAPVQGQ